MKCEHCSCESSEAIELLKESARNLTDAQREKRIDDFLAGWGGLKETRELACLYLEGSFWDVKLAQTRYWHEVILAYEYDL